MRARGGRARATRLTRGQGRRRTAAAAAAAGLVERVEHAESACRFGLGERTGHGECTPVLGAEHRGRADACVARAARLLHGLLNARRLGGMPSAAPSSLDARQRWPEAPPPPAAPPQWQPCLANALSSPTPPTPTSCCGCLYAYRLGLQHHVSAFRRAGTTPAGLVAPAS